MQAEEVIGITESVCPVCLKRVAAKRIALQGNVYLDKTCPEHGNFRTIIWRGEPAYRSWALETLPSRPPKCATDINLGCPFDCGLCPDHRQHSCCVLLEVTQRCNLACPVCFAAAGGAEQDPDISVIETWYRTLLESGGPYNIQLSGGEPALRDDLPEIVALGRSMGYDFFQLNTNGIRLAEDIGYLKRLKQAGLSCVFLQFDGTADAIYLKIRGAELLEIKQAAIAHCAEQQVGVVLVPTLVPGVNTGNIGEIIQFALARMPAVRGVHFQPVSYFGRYPKLPADENRITIPEVIREIERQTGGRMKITDFHPPAAENSYCSFQGNFILMEDGGLKPLGKKDQCGCGCQPQGAAARKARKFVAKHWAAPQAGGNIALKKEANSQVRGLLNVDSLDHFLERVEQNSLCISGMAFQDAWNIDLDRLRDCFIHVVGASGRIIPFCAYNLTDQQGRSLYRSTKGVLP